MIRPHLSHAIAFCSLLLTASGVYAFPPALDTTAFVAYPILSRPTDHSVTVTVLPKDSMQVYYDYGVAPAVYSLTSEKKTGAPDIPLTVVLGNLAANTRYYYRIRYKKNSATSFLAGDEHIFHTQRSKGNTYRFTIESDPHPYDKKGSHTLWPITLRNQLADSADFLLDLGDTFGDDHNPTTITSNEMRQLHLDGVPYFGLVCHSSPLFLCLGNHEGESGYYLLQTPPNNLAVYGTTWRKFYYPNPVPDGFFSGNSTVEGFGIGLPENYYAWEWGDALLVVLDAYRGYTGSAKPRGWEWTLGKEQYEWFKKTLEGSSAKYKFVFAHHTLGETRGGAVTARLYEWGGYEGDGQTWGFSANRPGWGMPIHQLMVQHGVTIYFQGHDHLFAKETVDGIVYQEVPMPSDSTYIIGMRDNGDSYTDIKRDGSGHVRVTVAPDSVNVEYVQAWLPVDENASRRNRQVAYSYAVRPTVASAGQEAERPGQIALEQNYPNPFNPATTIAFRLQNSQFVTLKVYDILGQEVAVLVDERKNAGVHQFTFDGSRLASGMYVYRLTAGQSVECRKMVLMK